VTDPQKYADADWHDEYLKPLSAHGGVTLILLNQVDKLPAGAMPECLGDLRRLVDADGLDNVTILPVSARTGEGVGELRAELAELVAGRRAATDRLAADVASAGAALAPLIGVAPDGDQIPEADRERALAGLRAAAGVSSLADAVAARTVTHTLPLVSSPLRALGRLNRRENETAIRTAGPEAPAAVPVDRGGLDLVLNQFANAITQKLPTEWGRAISTRVTGSRREVAEQLDLALGQCELAAIDSAREGTMGARVGHVLFVLLAAIGLLGGAVGGIAVLPPGGPLIAAAGGAALLIGLLGTLLLDVRARAAARARAIKSGQVAAGSLAVELAAVAQDGLFAAAETELDRHRRAYEAFRTAYS
jgi:hypothetical protein